jgi:hypothetical protein
MIEIRGTCSVCQHYHDGRCQSPSSQFSKQAMWSIACVPCGAYARLRASAPLNPRPSAGRRPTAPVELLAAE